MPQDIGSTSVLATATLPSSIEIWWNALVRPTISTYAVIANDPRASSQTAYTWVVRTALVAGLLLGLTQAGTNLGAICLGPIFAALLSLVWFALVAGISQFAARAAGGTGTYGQLAYTIAAYSVPLSLVTAAVGAIAPNSFLSVPLSLYGLILLALAVKAVHQLSWIRAAIPIVILGGLGMLVFACLLFGTLTVVER